MITKLEGRYHWVSIGCMAMATAMVCVGNTALEAGLEQSGIVISMIYWSICAAFTVATTGFACMAVLSAQQHIRELEVKITNPVPISSGARFSAVKKQHVES